MEREDAIKYLENLQQGDFLTVNIPIIADKKIQVTDKDGNIVDEWTSGKEAHKVKGLKEGETYKLHEEVCVNEYVKAIDIEFKVTTDKETQKIEMKDMPILKDIKVVKIDSKTKEIIKAKFTFGLYEDEECTKLIQQMDSNKDEGIITFEDLRYGTYFIKEITAPKGYNKSDEVAKVEINDKGVFINGNLIEEKDSAYSFEFENAPIETPNTNDGRNTLLLSGIAGMSALTLATIGIYEIIKRRKNK